MGVPLRSAPSYTHSCLVPDSPSQGLAGSGPRDSLETASPDCLTRNLIPGKAGYSSENASPPASSTEQKIIVGAPTTGENT